ncbi:MAG: amidohydrolase family protein [Verrucomicrobiales bacterium]|nr:amidohydrolase family protein [Verrucomicrobiales bacterium]
MNRRDFIAGTVASSAVGSVVSVGARTTSRSQGAGVDVNVMLGQWPTRRLPLDDADRLARKLRDHGVQRAWAGTFEALLHKDLGAANARLAEMCRRQGGGLFEPRGSVDPTRPDWEEEVRRCAEVHGMRGLRLHPNYHGYRLDHPAVPSFFAAAAARRLIVEIAVVMEDERMMHPLLRVEPVDTAPLPDLIRSVPRTRIVLLNALRTVRAKPLLDLMATGAVWVELSMIEGLGGVRAVLDQIPRDRLLFGSHAPLFYFEAAWLKLRESVLTDRELDSIRWNAVRALHGD